MSYASLKKDLADGHVVILDGGIGTELEARGVPMSEAAWCGLAGLTHPEILTQIHRDYIAAGARIITANTFASSRLMLDLAGMGGRLDEVVEVSLECAKRARDGAKDPGLLIAGSISHMVPLAPGSNSIIQGVPDDEVLAEVLGELAQSLARHGADFILLEMMYTPDRTRLAMQAAVQTGLPVWCGFSARRGGEGEILSFSRSEEIEFIELARILGEFQIDAAGIMHSPVDVTEDAINLLGRHFEGPLMAYPDSGYFAMPHWQFVDIIDPEGLSQYAKSWYQSGARVFGGCCGLGIDHIRALAQTDLTIHA